MCVVAHAQHTRSEVEAGSLLPLVAASGEGALKFSALRDLRAAEDQQMSSLCSPQHQHLCFLSLLISQGCIRSAELRGSVRSQHPEGDRNPNQVATVKASQPGLLISGRVGAS